MTNFYDNWLGMWAESQAEKEKSRRVIHDEEIEWVETVQDGRAGLLIARETGFRTWGTVTMIAEIAPGFHSGEHKHGEEVIHFLGGEGFSIVDGIRYDWRESSTMLVPFGSRHQHFNTGDVPVRYVSSMSVGLEHFCGVHQTTQYEKQGRTTTLPSATRSEDGLNPDGKRVALDIDDAIKIVKSPPRAEDIPVIKEGEPLEVDGIDGMQNLAHVHKEQVWRIMRIGKDVNDFHPNHMEMSSVLTDAPRTAGGTHAHMEAHLYILEGSGHTVVDDEPVEWKAGSALHIVGPQTKHQHVNTSDTPSKMLRIAPGIRYFFERPAKAAFPYLFYSVREGLDTAAKG